VRRAMWCRPESSWLWRLACWQVQKTTDLVRTPLCPVDQGAPGRLLSRSAGFGSYDFTTIFRAETDVLDFRCLDICDGTKTFNTVECDGLYACNMATCAEDVTEEGNMVPVRACPVVITLSDSENIKLIPCYLMTRYHLFLLEMNGII
jgi:hypothetical protein